MDRIKWNKDTKSFSVNKLSDLNVGDDIALIREYYDTSINHTAVTISKKKVNSITSDTIKADGLIFDRKSGARKFITNSSSELYIMLPEDVNKYIKNGRFKDYIINGKNPFE